MGLFVLIFMTVAIYLVYKSLFKLMPNAISNSDANRYKDLIKEKTIHSSSLMQEVIDKYEASLKSNLNIKSTTEYQDFINSLQELETIIQADNINIDRLKVEIEGQDVTIRNFIVGSRLCISDLNRKISLRLDAQQQFKADINKKFESIVQGIIKEGHGLMTGTAVMIGLNTLKDKIVQEAKDDNSLPLTDFDIENITEEVVGDIQDKYIIDGDGCFILKSKWL